MAPKEVLLKVRPSHTQATRLASMARAILEEAGVRATEVGELAGGELRDFDAAIAIGGDGTLLSLFHSRWGKLPLLGIKDGSYGLLMELSRESLKEGLERFSKGDYFVEKALTLELVEGGALALNEVLFSTQSIGKAIRLRILVDGVVVNGFLGDGLIVSTPIGSLAYALAGRGPSMDPRMQAMEVVPLNPWPPSMLVPASAQLIPVHSEFRVESDREMIAVMDAQEELNIGKAARVRASDERAKLIRFSSDPLSYYVRIVKRIAEARRVAESKFLEGL